MNEKTLQKSSSYKDRGFWERNRLSGGYLVKKTLRHKVYVVLRALLLFGLCFMIVQPLLDQISVSFMAEKDLYDTTIVTIPRHLTTDNYKTAASKELLDYSKSLFNTTWICLVVSILQIAACTLVGYGFARFNFPLKKLWFACVILVIIIPPQTISTSLHLHFRYFDIFGIVKAIRGQGYAMAEALGKTAASPELTLNLRGSSIPYFMLSATCMGLKNGLYIFMIRQFFAGVPKSLEEAAYVDGCSTFKTFWRVILPDAVPILVSCFLFAFVWQWTDTFYSGLFLGGNDLLSMKVSGIADRFNNYLSIKLGTNTSASPALQQQMVSTGTVMVVAPLLVLYIFAQRGFVESISATGIKM